MKSLFLAISSVIALVALILVWQIKGIDEIKAYFKTRDGKGVLVGIATFIGIFIFGSILSMFARADDHGRWVNYFDIYAGIEDTFKQSPQCEAGMYSDKLTSNGGIVFNVYESYDKMFNFEGVYRHHSCALNPDSKSYDAVGVQIKYRLWGD